MIGRRGFMQALGLAPAWAAITARRPTEWLKVRQFTADDFAALFDVQPALLERGVLTRAGRPVLTWMAEEVRRLENRRAQTE